MSTAVLQGQELGSQVVEEMRVENGDIAPQGSQPSPSGSSQGSPCTEPGTKDDQEAPDGAPGTAMDLDAAADAQTAGTAAPDAGAVDEEELREAEDRLTAMLSVTPQPNIRDLGKALVAWQRARAGMPDPEGSSTSLGQRAAELLTEWRGALKLNDQLDVRSYKDQRWYSGKIIEYIPEDGKITIKYDHYSKSHNEIHILKPDNLDLMPYRAQTGKFKKPKRERDQEEIEREKARLEERKQAEVHTFLHQESTLIGQSRCGRQIKSCRPMDVVPRTSSATLAGDASQPQRKRRRTMPRKSNAQEGEEEGAPGQVYDVDTGGKDNNDWACGECDQLERDPKDRLVLCDGPCKRSFHQSCLGLSKKEVDALERYLCDQCTEREHTCFVCGDTGKDHVAGGVHKCQKPTCGKFYHQHCVNQMRGAVVAKTQDECEDEDQPFTFRFLCGRHVCDACGRGGDGIKARGRFYECLKCPRAYHELCIPPGCKYHDYLMLCPEHIHLDLPRLPGQEDMEDFVCTRGEGWVSLILGSLALPKSAPSRPSDTGHFRLPQRFFDEVYSKPPPYTHIPALRYTCKMYPIEPGPECSCTDTCGDNCLNRVLHIECVGLGANEQPSSRAASAVVRHHNCNAGPSCGNRAFQNKEYVKHELFREKGMGWGLKALEDVKKGQLVFEYVGEVIDEEELENRLESHARDHPNDNNMYIMELESGFYLDARHKGNSSRFINHSCEPNCELQKWNVRGFTRIGIMALTDIPAGTPLSYDYQFATKEEGKFKCYCGAPTCRGSLAPKKSEDAELQQLLKNGKLTKNDRKRALDLQRKKEKREQAKLEQLSKKCVGKRSLTSHLLPGDATYEIKSGPPPRFFGFAKDTKIFLVRNLKRGGDFIKRRALLQRKIEMLKQKA